jgi:hypothetical protein
VDHDSLTDFGKVGLERLKLAADIILAETDAIPDTLAVELVLFRERVERAMLLPNESTRASRTADGAPIPREAPSVPGSDR